jgi:hypothetical protein
MFPHLWISFCIEGSGQLLHGRLKLSFISSFLHFVYPCPAWFIHHVRGLSLGLFPLIIIFNNIFGVVFSSSLLTIGMLTDPKDSTPLITKATNEHNLS